MSEYQEFTGKNVEEALRNARESFGVTGLDDLDFEILTPGSRGVLGMGAEPARIVAAPRAALGGAAPRREAAASQPLPAPPARMDRPERDRTGDRDRGGDRAGRGFDRDRGGRGFDRDRGPARSGGPDVDAAPRPPRSEERGPRREERPAPPAPGEDAPVSTAGFNTSEPAVFARSSLPDEGAASAFGPGGVTREPRGPRRDRGDRAPRGDRGARDDRGADGGDRAPRGERGERRPSASLTQREQDQVAAARASLSVEREEIQAAEASPEALEAGREILEKLLGLMGFQVAVSVRAGETSKLDVSGEGDEKEALGALIGRKGERLSALQHLVNLMLSRRMGSWTRVLVDVEDYRGRRERQLQELATRAAQRVVETGKMLQLEPMPALERRWIHLALRNNPDVATQSIGEEPERRVVVLRRGA